jgi:phage I-like protein
MTLKIFDRMAKKGQFALVAVANEFKVGVEEGRLWMPFGKYPRAVTIKGKGRRQVLQVWDLDGAEAVSAKIANAIAAGDPGLPVYNGHPDVPELAAKYPDKGAVGWLVAMEIANEGATAVVEWNDAPPKKRFRWFSPYWDVALDSETDDGTTVTAYVYNMDSIGLTNQPAIHDFRLPNEAPPEIDLEKETNPERKDTVNREQLIALLGLPSDADDAAVEAAVKALVKRAEDAEAKLAEAETAKTAKEGELTAATEAKAGLETKLANERSARVDLLTQSALADARITPADLPRWKKLLTENFDANSVALANERPKLKTTQSSDPTKAISVANTSNRVQQITAAVEEQMAKGLSYDSAHAAVRRAQPELFKK